MLQTVTVIVNFMGVSIGLWLGIYVISRNSRSAIAWLTGLTLWSVAGFFLNGLMAIYPPPMPGNLPIWLRWLLPFWRVDTITGEGNAWLQGWSIALAVALWHHATVLMRPGFLTLWRWVRIAFGYVLAFSAVTIQTYRPGLMTFVAGNPLYVSSLKAGPLYPLYIFLFLLLIIFCIVNLIRSARAAPLHLPRRQLFTLTSATLIAGLSLSIAIAGTLLGIQIPLVLLSLAMAITVSMLGYGIARYSALVVGRTIRRDFIFNGVTVFLIVLIYFLIAIVSGLIYEIPPTYFLLMILLAIITHSLIDFARTKLDSLLMRPEAGQLRRNLQRLARLSIERGSLPENIQPVLDSICGLVRATYGVIITFEDESLEELATYHIRDVTVSLSKSDLMVDDVTPMELGHFPSPLSEAVLLIPLYDENDQFGVIILGHPVNGIQYSTNDIELLLYPGDQIADVIRSTRRETQYLQRVESVLSEYHEVTVGGPYPITVKMVENALRNLSSYAYLGDHPLAQMKVIRERLTKDVITHIDRGKIVNTFLVDLIEKLRPPGDLDKGVPSREWHQFLTLHEAYVNDVPNRDIMSRLYISEGTFNRTRRAALRALTRAIGEMEASLK